ncbi:hypothetical protein [Leptodesmis sichuanensis]|uniref:hypothetical protein n=1 Tax=Leptodesmis sichuanensis TaxID=2906798 RepID=UPI001F226EB4|nr:hypothetical protein [Leptodesmis sichuanensis]UIE38861.1 hypothetical protein KIK02_04390 [Leptodesmis sichuanensis A121]
MQPEPFTENSYKSDTLVPLEQEQYIMLLHEQMSEISEGTIYFSLPDQETYLYEYEGDLEEALQDLPEIYSATAVSTGVDQSVQPNLTLTPEATAVIEQLWNYFDQTGEKTFEGTQDYNFQVEGNWLLVVPKENAQEFFAISRDGQVNSTFSPEHQENLMDRFAIAYSGIYVANSVQNTSQDLVQE